MCTAVTIPLGLPGLQVDKVNWEENTLTMYAKTTGSQAACPDCGQVSKQVHSYYTGSPQDAPSMGQGVRLELRARRFRCANEVCKRKTFTEHLPEVVAARARRTVRLSKLLSGISFALGGEAGSRMGRLLHIQVSADTLLRLMRQTEAPDRTTPRVLGVDDWAWRKGRVYGTILVDLEQQQVVDLLPDRESASLANWLRDHPGVEIISRDRGGAYAEGARLGAPEAIQVADRWHLLKNLADALTVSYDVHQALLRQLHIVNEPSPDAPQAGQTEVTGAIPTTQPPSDASSRPLSPKAQMRQRRRQHWEHCFDQVHSLLEQGMTKKAVARELNLSIKTVRKYSRLPALPIKTSPKSGPRILDPYRAYLRERLGAEAVGHRQLWREIQMRGYAGGPTTVYEYTRHLRQELGLPANPAAPSTCFTK
jgi:transposase